jgi:hypothetical protein
VESIGIPFPITALYGYVLSLSVTELLQPFVECTACAGGSYCASPSSNLVAKIGLWTATVLVIIAVGFPRIAALFL